MIDLASHAGRLEVALELRDIAKTLEDVAAGKTALIVAGWSSRYLRDVSDAIGSGGPMFPTSQDPPPPPPIGGEKDW